MALPLLALTACATLVEGDDQTVTIVSDPAGATCTLTRKGVEIGAVTPTPGSIVLEKSSDDASVVCSKAGHFDGAAALSSSFQNMTIGNVLFGGIIGVAVDAASGAMHEYPASITILLTPKRFTGTAERDAFFERRTAQIEADAKAAEAAVRKKCVPDEQDCDALVAKVKEERDARIRQLEDERAAAQVDGG